MDVFGEQQSSARVPKIVEPNVRKVALLLDPLEAAVYDVPAPPRLSHVVRENQTVILGPRLLLLILQELMPAKSTDGDLGETYAPLALDGFRGTNLEPSLVRERLLLT